MWRFNFVKAYMGCAEPKFIAEIADWYWQFGIQRKGKYKLPPGSWGDEITSLARTASTLAMVKSQSKASMAIWGPSQTGKSTLISQYVDGQSNARGEGSALHWPDGGPPARFVTKDPTLAEALVLNPFAHGSDASGCVSRFVLRETLDDQLHSVRVQLGSDVEVLHALAMGYLSECKLVNDNGATTFLDPEIFRNKMRQFLGGSGKSKGSIRHGFEFLHDLGNLIEALIWADLSRYTNLRGKWPNLRVELLEHAALLPESRALIEFAAAVLWDGKPQLTALYKQILKGREDWERRCGEKPVFCTLEVASLLLDIDSYQKLKDDKPTNAVRDRIRSIGLQESDDRVHLGLNYAEKVIHEDEDFGILQGLVWELEIPLRSVVLEQAAPAFCGFLEVCDLLDFPGVAQAYENQEQTRIDLDSLRPEDSHKLFTELLKRGKTASIASSYAKKLSIDSFSIFTRWARFPAQPGQLTTGISTWWRYIDSTYNAEDNQPSPLPLNIVLTFCATLVNNVVQSGLPNGLKPVFLMLNKLGTIARPAVVTQTFATNYTQFPEGVLIKDGVKLASDSLELKRAKNIILQDEHFRNQFASEISRDSFGHMLLDGGTDYFFIQLTRQAEGSRRRDLLDQREIAVFSKFHQILQNILPTKDSVTEKRRLELTAWADHIRNAIVQCQDEEPIASLSLALRRLLDVNPESLEKIPQNLVHVLRPVVKQYVEAQFVRWKNFQEKSFNSSDDWALLGIKDGAHLSRLLSYLAEAIRLDGIAEWLKKYFGRLTEKEECEQARRFLGTKMANYIVDCGQEVTSVHASPDKIRQSLLRFAAAENHFGDPMSSPHVSSFVLPFIEQLYVLARQAPAGGWEKQPGDEELLAILVRYSKTV